MASKLFTVKLRETQINLLLDLLEQHERSGYYYGNKEQHYKLIKDTIDDLERA